MPGSDAVWILLGETTLILLATCLALLAGRRRRERLKRSSRGEGEGLAADYAHAAKQDDRRRQLGLRLAAGGAIAAVLGLAGRALAHEPPPLHLTILAIGILLGPLAVLVGAWIMATARERRSSGAAVRRHLGSPGARAALAAQSHGPRARDLADGRSSRATWMLGVGIAATVAGALLVESQTAANRGDWQESLGTVAVASGITVTVIAQRERNRQALQVWRRWCEARGWSFSATGIQDPIATTFPRHNLEIRRVVRGRVGGVAFASWNARPTGMATDQYHVVEIVMPASSPGLGIRLRGAVRRATGIRRGIETESQGFSDLLHIDARDARFAHEVLHPRVMELVLGAGAELSWRWEGTRLFVARAGAVEPDDVLDLLPVAMAFRDLVPRHLATRGLPDLGGPVPAR